MNAVTWIGVLLCISQSALFSGLNLAIFSVSRLRLEVETDFRFKGRFIERFLLRICINCAVRDGRSGAFLARHSSGPALSGFQLLNFQIDPRCRLPETGLAISIMTF